MTTYKGNSLIDSPRLSACTFLDFPLVKDLDEFQADIAILGVPFGMPYTPDSMANDQSQAPDAIRQFTNKSAVSFRF